MDSTTAPADGRHRYVTQMDEMSLADEQSAQTPDSEPDTLEVRDDSMVIFQGVLNDFRRPLLMVLAAAGAATLVAVAIAAITGAAGRNAPRPPA